MKGKIQLIILMMVMMVMMVMMITQLSIAQASVIVNSGKWEDVYSGMLYTGLKGEEGYFLTSEKYGKYLLTVLKDEPVTLIESPQAYVANYESTLNSNGF